MMVRAATMDDAFEFAGAKPFLRKALLAQVRRFPSLTVEHEGAALALATFHAVRRRRVEFALWVKPEAGRHMTALVRLARLTLAGMAQDRRLVLARVALTDRQARRMAGLAGFINGRFEDRSIMLWKGDKRWVG